MSNSASASAGAPSEPPPASSPQPCAWSRLFWPQPFSSWPSSSGRTSFSPISWRPSSWLFWPLAAPFLLLGALRLLRCGLLLALLRCLALLSGHVVLLPCEG